MIRIAAIFLSVLLLAPLAVAPDLNNAAAPRLTPHLLSIREEPAGQDEAGAALAAD